NLDSIPELLVVIGGFALLFFVVGLIARTKLFTSLLPKERVPSPLDTKLRELLGESMSSSELAAQVPALSAILPFLLLIMVSAKLPLLNPSPLFGLALLLAGLLLTLVLIVDLPVLGAVSLACVLALEHAWNQEHFNRAAPTMPIVWALAFYALFTV